MRVDRRKCRRQLARTRRDSRRPSVLDLVDPELLWPTQSVQDRIFRALLALAGS